MTRIDFYTHADRRLPVACQLTTKAIERGLKVALFAEDRALLEAVDRLLWTVPATGFVPHCHDDDRLAARTPVVLCSSAPRNGHEDVLINLSSVAPDFFARFERLIEIVTGDDADRDAARVRYRFYRERGYEIQAVDLSTRGQN